MKKKPMNKTSASRIQSATCRQNEGSTPKNSFASRAMSAADRNEHQSLTGTSKKTSLAQACCQCGLFVVTTAVVVASVYYSNSEVTPGMSW